MKGRREENMANEKTYNGWTNYETWAVALWLDNEEPSQRYWREAADEALEHAKANPEEYEPDPNKLARYALAERLKSELDEAMPDLGATLWADLLRASFSEVNWFEIAKNMFDEE